MSTEPLTSTDEARKAWLARRRSIGLGGSDAPVAIGISPFKSPFALWVEKSGLIQPDELEEEYQEWGHLLEPPIAAKYERVTGRRLRHYGDYHIFTSERYPWMFATIDRGIEPIDERGEGTLSIKTTGAWHAGEWKEEPPLYCQVQLQHELVVRNLQWGSFAILIGGQKFHWCDASRNERFCSYLVEKEDVFMDGVRRGDPPMPDGSDSTKEVLSRLYPEDTGEVKALPAEAAAWIERRSALKADVKRVAEEIQEVENLLKATLGDATRGFPPSGPGVSWKSQHRDGYTVAPTDFRVLREIKRQAQRRAS